jgi:hypothetical protein
VCRAHNDDVANHQGRRRIANVRQAFFRRTAKPGHQINLSLTAETSDWPTGRGIERCEMKAGRNSEYAAICFAVSPVGDAATGAFARRVFKAASDCGFQLDELGFASQLPKMENPLVSSLSFVSAHAWKIT